MALGREQGNVNCWHLPPAPVSCVSPSLWTLASWEVAAFEHGKGVANLPRANPGEMLSRPTGRLLKPSTSNWS